VPTLTGRVLFVLVILSHHRRRIVHVGITEHPTAEWTAQQIIEAFPEDTAPRWLLRDRDAIYGDLFRQRVAGMGIGEVVTSPGVRWSAADTIDLSDAPPDLSTSLARDAHEAQERTGSCGVARPRRTPSEVNPVFG